MTRVEWLLPVPFAFPCNGFGTCCSSSGTSMCDMHDCDRLRGNVVFKTHSATCSSRWNWESVWKTAHHLSTRCGLHISILRWFLGSLLWLLYSPACVSFPQVRHRATISICWVLIMDGAGLVVYRFKFVAGNWWACERCQVLSIGLTTLVTGLLKCYFHMPITVVT